MINIDLTKVNQHSMASVLTNNTNELKEVCKSGSVNEIYNYVNVLYEKGKQFTNINYTNNIVSTIANLNIEKESNKDNKLLINFEYDLDYLNEKMVLASSIYNNNNEISNLIYNYEDANLYILLKKAYNKPILYDNNNLFKTKSNQEVTYDDYFYIFTDSIESSECIIILLCVFADKRHGTHKRTQNREMIRCVS